MDRLGELIGKSAVMQHVYYLLKRAAASTLPVLLQGETGTGKELAARTLHQLSGATGAFIPIHCGTIPETLFENILFGHAKGAYTGAETVHLGMVSQAEHGTLFLDEIAKLTRSQQIKLLRLLSEHEYYAVGSGTLSQFHGRFIFATNQNLEGLVAQDKFQEDLWYRIKVLTITLPSLRQRYDDIPLLLHHFLEQRKLRPKEINPQIFTWIQQRTELHGWPGNVRELKNVFSRFIEFDDPLCDSQWYTLSHDPAGQYLPLADVLANLEARYILEVLSNCQGDKECAAMILGISHRTLDRKCAEYSIYTENQKKGT